MGNRGLEKDPCMKTHKKHYKEFKKFSKLLIIENVSEYSVPLVEEELGELWTLKVTRLDPRLFGLPVARARLYIIAFRNDELQWVSDLTLDDFVAMLSSECVMSARNLFWMTTQEKELTTAEVTKLQYSCVSDLEDPGKNRYLQNFLCPQFRGISCIPRFQNPVQESFIEIEFIFNIVLNQYTELVLLLTRMSPGLSGQKFEGLPGVEEFLFPRPFAICEKWSWARRAQRRLLDDPHNQLCPDIFRGPDLLLGHLDVTHTVTMMTYIFFPLSRWQELEMNLRFS